MQDERYNKSIRAVVTGSLCHPLPPLDRTPPLSTATELFRSPEIALVQMYLDLCECRAGIEFTE